jgi:hypothetical protein
MQRLSVLVKRLLCKLPNPFARHVPEGRHVLVRCETCNRIMWRDGTEVRSEAHAGHRFRTVTEGTFKDWLRLKTGLVR